MTFEHHLQQLIDTAVQEALERHLPRLVERLTLPPDPDTLRSYAATAEYLGVGISTIRDMVRRGELYTVGRSGGRRIPHRAIQKLIWQAADKAAFECDQDPKSPSLRFATDDADPEIAAGLGLKSKSSPRHRGTA